MENLLVKGAIKQAPTVVESFFSPLFLVTKKDGTFRSLIDLSLNKFVENSHFQLENIKALLQRATVYLQLRPERRLPVGPSQQRLLDVPAISVEKQMLCLSRPLFWLKHCSKGFYQTLKTSSRILTQAGRSYDPLSRRLAYPRFISRGSTEKHLSGCYTLGKFGLHS